MIDIYTNEDEQWAPVSDLMAALMLIFMFIAVISPVLYGAQAEEIEHREEVLAQQEAAIEQQVEELALEARNAEKKCSDIHLELKAKFDKYFEIWEAKLEEDLTIEFYNPKILFDQGRASISPEFEGILDKFFPLYMDALSSHKPDIQEIRIEGHTSSEYEDAKTEDEAYIKNMELSQDRAREILQYVLAIPDEDGYKSWAKSKITANGLSSSRLVYFEFRDFDGRIILDTKGYKIENPDASRRVEFRLLTSSCQKAGRYT